MDGILRLCRLAGAARRWRLAAPPCAHGGGRLAHFETYSHRRRRQQRRAQEQQDAEDDRGLPAHDPSDFAAAAQTTARKQDWRAALAALNRAPEEPGQEWAPAFYAVLACCCRVGRYFEAISVWERMPHRDEKAYNMLINLCGRLRRLPEAEAFFEDMAGASLEPSGVTYCSLLNGLAAQAHWQRACQVLEEMRHQPRLAFTTDWGQVHLLAMSACARAGEYAKTRTIFAEHCDIAPPRPQHFNALLVACASAADGVTAEAVFVEMRAVGLAPREIDWNVLIQCFRQDFAACRRLLAEMRAEPGVEASEETFAALLQAASLGEGQASDVHWVLDELRNSGVVGSEAASPRLRRELRRVGAA